MDLNEFKRILFCFGFWCGLSGPVGGGLALWDRTGGGGFGEGFGGGEVALDEAAQPVGEAAILGSGELTGACEGFGGEGNRGGRLAWRSFPRPALVCGWAWFHGGFDY